LCPGAGFEVRGFDGRDPHQAHQALQALAVDRPALGPQHRRHPARAQERMGQE
jgi:hypothetical protein